MDRSSIKGQIKCHLVGQPSYMQVEVIVKVFTVLRLCPIIIHQPLLHVNWGCDGAQIKDFKLVLPCQKGAEGENVHADRVNQKR